MRERCMWRVRMGRRKLQKHKTGLLWMLQQREWLESGRVAEEWRAEMVWINDEEENEFVQRT